MPAPTRAEYLTIDGVPIPCPAWEAKSLLPLWQGPDVRGSDRRIPGAAGVKPYRRRADVSTRTLELVIYGFEDPDGNPNADVREGLEANVFYFRSTIADPTGAGDGTRTAVLHLPSGATKTGPVHVVSFDLGELGPTSVRATLDLSLPEGALS